METNNEVEQRPVTSRYPRMGSFLDRLIAAIIDSFILSLIISVVLPLLYFGFSLAVMMIFHINLSTVGSSNIGAFVLAYFGIYAIFGFLVWGITFFYYGYFYTTHGQTIGKKLMKLKVVKVSDIQYLSWKVVFIREVLGKWISGLLMDLGYFWYFMSPKRQTWHDSIASTYVVKTDDAGNILMDGLAEYEKSVAKTFLPLGCMAILFVALMASMIIMALAVGDGAVERSKNLDRQVKQDWNTDFKVNNKYTIPEGYVENPRKEYSQEGELCGGEEFKICAKGLSCKYDLESGDFSGVCIAN